MTPDATARDAATPDVAAARVAFDRRRRARNWAILAALIAMVVLFYFVAVARITAGLEQGAAERAAAGGGPRAPGAANTTPSAAPGATDAARPAR